ncbi:hypothetical protein EJB05_02924, partial [Eragrostis curvula]
KEQKPKRIALRSILAADALAFLALCRRSNRGRSRCRGRLRPLDNMKSNSPPHPMGFTRLYQTMFFPGTIENRSIVCFRGSSPKELDRESLMEHIMAERRKRKHKRQCKAAALHIQRKFKARMDKCMSILEPLEELLKQKALFPMLEKNAIEVSQMISLFNICNEKHLLFLSNIGRLFTEGHLHVNEASDTLKVVLGRLALLCLKVYTKHYKKEHLNTALFLGNLEPSIKLHLQRTGSFSLLRAIIQQEKADRYLLKSVMTMLLESIPEGCLKIFVCEILTLPLIFKRFNGLEEVFAGDTTLGNDLIKTICFIICQPEEFCPYRSNKYQAVESLFFNLLDIASVLMPQLLPITVSAVVPLVTTFLDSEEINGESKMQITEAFNHQMLEKMVKSIICDRHGIWDDVVESLFTFLQSLFRHATDLYALYTQLSFGTDIIPVLSKFIVSCSHNPRVVLALPAYCPLLSQKLCSTKREDIGTFGDADPFALIEVLKKAMWAALSDEHRNLAVHSQLADGIQKEVGAALNKLRDWFVRTSKSTSVFYCVETTHGSFSSMVEEEGSIPQKIIRAAPLLVDLRTKINLFKAIDHFVVEFNIDNPWTKRYKFNIRRNEMLRDVLHLLAKLPKGGIRGKITVIFYDANNRKETGFDDGGLFKEMVSEVFKLACNACSGLFEETDNHQFYPNKDATNLEKLEHFKSLGRLLGKAISEGVPLDQELAPFFCKKLKKKYNSFSDMLLLDENIYNSLCLIKNYDEETILNSELDFEGLIPDGDRKRVTKNNVIMYAHLKANEYLNTKIQKQTSYFLDGLYESVQPEWFQMFDKEELKILISGTSEVDVDDLERHTIYDGFNKDDTTVQLFWEVFREIPAADQKKLLRFVTSCPRAPAGGFEYLNPNFTILRCGDDVEQLPTASTCHNILKIPPYDRKEQLHTKLKTAIDSGFGFELF